LIEAPVANYDEIKKLDELRKAGLITDQEFDAQKKKILERK
jgi:Short C-terminal domain